MEASNSGKRIIGKFINEDSGFFTADHFELPNENLIVLSGLSSDGTNTSFAVCISKNDDGSDNVEFYYDALKTYDPDSEVQEVCIEYWFEMGSILISRIDNEQALINAINSEDESDIQKINIVARERDKEIKLPALYLDTYTFGSEKVVEVAFMTQINYLDSSDEKECEYVITVVRLQYDSNGKTRSYIKRISSDYYKYNYLLINFTADSDGNLTSDKSFESILSAYNSNKNIFATYSDDTVNNLALTLSSAPTNSGSATFTGTRVSDTEMKIYCIQYTNKILEKVMIKTLTF